MTFQKGHLTQIKIFMAPRLAINNKDKITRLIILRDGEREKSQRKDRKYTSRYNVWSSLKYCNGITEKPN